MKMTCDLYPFCDTQGCTHTPDTCPYAHRCAGLVPPERICVSPRAKETWGRQRTAPNPAKAREIFDLIRRTDEHITAIGKFGGLQTTLGLLRDNRNLMDEMFCMYKQFVTIYRRKGGKHGIQYEAGTFWPEPGKPMTSLGFGDTLNEVRKFVPPGFIMCDHDPNDPMVIVESWKAY